mgnify:CR=1 FL=1
MLNQGEWRDKVIVKFFVRPRFGDVCLNRGQAHKIFRHQGQENSQERDEKTVPSGVDNPSQQAAEPEDIIPVLFLDTAFSKEEKELKKDRTDEAPRKSDANGRNDIITQVKVQDSDNGPEDKANRPDQGAKQSFDQPYSKEKKQCEKIKGIKSVHCDNG